MGTVTSVLTAAYLGVADICTNVLMAAPAGGTPSGGGTTGNKFDLKNFFKNLTNYTKDIGHYLMVFAGVILIVVAVVQIAKGLAGGGRGQVNWVMSIACLLVGGMLFAGGWKLASSVASMGKDTIEEMATGTYSSEIDEGGMAVQGLGGNGGTAAGTT